MPWPVSWNSSSSRLLSTSTGEATPGARPVPSCSAADCVIFSLRYVPPSSTQRIASRMRSVPACFMM
ncbi:MAG: hypothetical protein IPO18_03590 [bacterium]|nr:hypothetical protein [bacterium]